MWGWAGVVAHMRLHDLATSSTLYWQEPVPVCRGQGTQQGHKKGLSSSSPGLLSSDPRSLGSWPS